MKETTKNIICQEGGFLNFLCPLLKARLPLIKHVLTPLAKSVLIPLGLTPTSSATDAAIQKKIYVLGMTTLIITNKEMDDIMKILKSLEESGLLMKGVSKTINNEVKKWYVLGMLVGT